MGRKLQIRKIFKFFLEINTDFFQYTLITYLVLLLTDTLWERSVSYRLDLGNLLFAVVVSGTIMVLAETRLGKEGKTGEATD